MKVPIKITAHAHVNLDPNTTPTPKGEALAAARLLSYAHTLFYLVGMLGELGVISNAKIDEDDAYDALTLVSELGRGLMDSAEVIVSRLGSVAEKGGAE